MGKISVKEIVTAIIITILTCGITFIFARGELINKKADYDYVDKRDMEVKAELKAIDERNEKEHEDIKASYQREVEMIRQYEKENSENIKELIRQTKR